MSDSVTDNMPPPGAITWTEIPVLSTARAQKFYDSVFGWTFVPQPTVCPETGVKLGEPEVIIFSMGKYSGSLVKVAEGNHLSPATHPDNPNKDKVAVRVTVTVGSIEESMKKVEQAGGEVYKPKKAIPNNMGHIAYFLDTEKNVMGLWSMN